MNLTTKNNTGDIMSILLKIIKYVFIVFIILFLITFSGIYIYSKKINYYIPNRVEIQIYDNNDELITTLNNYNNKNYVTLSNINKNIINAFISIEDKDFYKHNGISIKRTIGALIEDIKQKNFSQGGSTITQQYVKNIFLTSEKTLKRKIDEAFISVNIERNYSKDEILEGYLNTIYFDHGLYGIEDASLFYFNKHASEISLSEACVLASIPKSPSRYSPIRNFENNKKRKELILKEMYNDKYITSTEYTKALNEEIIIYGELDKSKLSNAPYYIDCIINEVKNLNLNNNQSIKVYTNYDSNLNKIITNSIKKYFPNDNELQIAIFALDSNGGILNCIGGKNYLESTFNRATSSLRQPGSTVKPFLYYAALESGFNVANTFYSTKTDFKIDGKIYSPSNYNDKYAEQDISMVYALAVSDNIYALKTHLFLGTNVLYDTLKDFGITSQLNNNPSLALGTSEVYLDELTTAYCKLSSLGKDITPSYINKITTFDDTIIYKNSTTSKQTFNKETCFILSEALTNIFDPNLRINISPTGSSVSTKLSSKYAAKSGSTDYDNWIIGYNNNITLGIWTGYDDNRKINNNTTRYIKYIWADVMEEYNKSFNKKWYDIPETCIGIKLNPINGNIPSQNTYSKYLYFKKDNIPYYLYEYFN